VSSPNHNMLATEFAPPARTDELCRIEAALRAAGTLLGGFKAGQIHTEYKEPGDPVTAADRAVNRLLLEMLPRGDEGWLSEETADSTCRLRQHRVWIVDPLDGTREFVAGVPEWCVSIAFIEDGHAVAGGISNPATGEIFLGSLETGFTMHCDHERQGKPGSKERPVVLASRSEVKRGEWAWLRDAPFEIRPMGSVAYKLALVAAGLADATWTLTPKHEWDVAAGVALVEASGGKVRTLEGGTPIFNRAVPWLSGLAAFSARTRAEFMDLFEEWLSRPSAPCAGAKSLAAERTGPLTRQS
jgi:myo-inositol-1(or 4)-monophosphatase